jgi:Domain of unknown function (DUF4838)/Glycosyl hydrolases family 2, sugar binding domain
MKLRLYTLIAPGLLFASSSLTASSIYSTNFSDGNNDGWIAHGGDWKWQKAPVKKSQDGQAVYVDGKVRQIYLIKSLNNLKIGNPKRIVFKLRLKVDGKTPPQYISYSISQGKIHISKNRVRIPTGKWFDWEIPLMSMSGPGKKRFNVENGGITKVKLFLIKRKNSPENEVLTMSLAKLSIVEGAPQAIKKISLNKWKSPANPKIQQQALQPLVETNPRKQAFVLNENCIMTAPKPVLDVVNELNAELTKTLKKKLVIAPSVDDKRYFIRIHHSGENKLKLSVFPEGESFKLIINKDGVLLQAGTRIGLINGVYGLLQGLGYRWYMPEALGECLPKNTVFPLKAVNEVIAPALEMRFIWYAWGLWAKGYNSPKNMQDFEQWSRRNRIKNSTNYKAYHNFYRVFPKNKYFKDHSEYFSLIKCKRVAGLHNGQVCATNPEVISIFAQSAITKFKQYPQLKGDSLTPNDNPYMCQCKNCMKYQDPSYLVNTRTYAYGNPEGADLHIRMMNQVRKLIAPKFPDKYLVTIVNYDNISRPPRHITPDKNLVFGFTTMPCCKLHALNDRNCPVNREFVKIYKAWHKFGNPVYIRDYDPMVYEKGLPSLLTGPISATLNYCGSSPAFLGFNSEAHKSWATNTPNFYLKSRFGWEHKPNLKNIMDNYYIQFFGPAAKEMKQYYSLFTYLLQNSPWHPVARELDNAILGIFTAKNLKALSTHLDSAINVCPAKSVYVQRISLLKMNFDYLKLYVKMLQYINMGKSASAITVISQMKVLVEKLDNSYSSAIVKKYVDGELDKIANSLQEQQASKDGKKVVINLNRCSFKTDLNNTGIKDEWFAINHSAAGWERIGLTAAWEKQGYDYNGVAWYREKFSLPVKYKNKKIMLYVGALDEEGVFYINGKKAYVRQHLTPGSWKERFEFDVSKYLKYGSDNIIAIRVTDTAGAGGIWKGMFLYHK